MTQKFKHDSGNLSMQLDRFMKNYGADDDLLFENSVQVSDVFERIAQLDEHDIRRVIKLMDKIESEKQYPKISHD